MDFFPKKTTGSCRCDVCDITVNSEVQLVQHRTGKVHLRKMHRDLPPDEAGRFKDDEEMDPITQAVVNSALGKLPTKRKATPQSSCTLCDSNFNSEAQAAQHYSSVRHAKKVKMLETTKNMETDEDSPERDTNGEDLGKKLGLFFCSLCNISVNSMQQLDAHKSGNKHGNKMQKLDGKCLDDCKDGESLECKDDD